ESTYDVTVLSTGHLEVRRADIVLRDGVEVSRTYHRHVVTPGDDVSGEPEIVQQLAATIWPTLPNPPADPTLSHQILDAPEDLFGGPTLGELFNFDGEVGI
ncbi:MAG TPA: hypothetical protein VK602_00445, partial [Phyllobacterium sp.]|nr:hypothetical protein [Phyllobacterium sp.]